MVGLVAAVCCFGQKSGVDATSGHPEFSISLAPPVGPIRLGTPIIVTVTVTNVAHKDIWWRSDISKDSPYLGFRYLLTRDGREVETTFFHRKITGRQRPDDPSEVSSGSAITSPLAPGKMFAIRIDLTRLYEITVPGQYTLIVSRSETGSSSVRSKPLLLKIER
jgi:hypothetical protein